MKYMDYLKIVGCRVEYLLENGTAISFVYKKEDFIHLSGIHKLKDIPMIRYFNDDKNKPVNAAYVLRKIKKENFTDADVRSSVIFSQIEERYNRLSYNSLASLTYTGAIINFNASSVGSIIKSDYLLYEQTEDGGYNHLGIALDSSSSKRYVETFFHELTDSYVCGQVVSRVVKFSLYDPNGNLIVEDTF